MTIVTDLDWARMLTKVCVGYGGACWIWLGARTGEYGGYTLPGQRITQAHRLSYVRNRGSIPAGCEIDHLCRNRLCVNPDHLEAVTHRENIRRSHGPVAERAAATVCKHGHAFTPENTRTRPNGTRACITCCRARCNATAARRRARGVA